MGTHYIVDGCINCGACAEVCPVVAISEQGDTHKIDMEICVDCGACDSVCPVGWATTVVAISNSQASNPVHFLTPRSNIVSPLCQAEMLTKKVLNNKNHQMNNDLHNHKTWFANCN